MKYFFGVAFSVLFSACAASEPRLFWSVKELALLPAERIGLQHPNGQTLATVSTRRFKRILLAQYRVARAAGIDAALMIADGEDPNAFAGSIPGRKVIAINVAMLKLLGDDIDAVAFLLGHEAAHLAKRHAETGESRTKTIQGIGSIVGVGLGMAGVPAAGALTGVAVDLIDASYSRDQEREADSLSVSYMSSAGYDPQGAIRLHERLLKASSGTLLPFLSSHPSGDERIQNLKALIRTMEPAGPNVVR